MLERTSRELADLRDVRHDFRGILGSDRVDDQLSEFFEHWSDGMDRISKHTHDVAERVNGAARAYQQTEEALVRNATPAGR